MSAITEQRNFTSGSRLDPYEIATSIGAGGMGEVFRARETRLNRDVAVKVLPKDFVADADRLRRFEQESTRTWFGGGGVWCSESPSLCCSRSESVGGWFGIEESQVITRKTTENVEAYDHYMKGRFHLTRGTREGFEQALVSFNEAIRLDGKFARAYSGIVDAYSFAMGWFVEDTVALSLGMVAATNAVALHCSSSLSPRQRIGLRGNTPAPERVWAVSVAAVARQASVDIKTSGILWFDV